MGVSRAKLNFVTSPSGLLVPDVVDDAVLEAAEVTFDIEPSASDGDVLTTDSGAVVWAAPTGGGGTDPFTTVTKASDESVTSSVVVQNDDHLFFTAVNGGVYAVELFLIYGSPAGAGGPDFKFDLGEDTGVRGIFLTGTFSTADALSSVVLRSNQTDTGTAGGAAANRMLWVTGSHVGAGGTFRLRWAQNASTGNATILRAGSELRYRRII